MVQMTVRPPWASERSIDTDCEQLLLSRPLKTHKRNPLTKLSVLFDYEQIPGNIQYPVSPYSRIVEEPVLNLFVGYGGKLNFWIHVVCLRCIQFFLFFVLVF